MTTENLVFNLNGDGSASCNGPTHTIRKPEQIRIRIKTPKSAIDLVNGVQVVEMLTVKGSLNAEDIPTGKVGTITVTIREALVNSHTDMLRAVDLFRGFVNSAAFLAAVNGTLPTGTVTITTP